MGGPDEMDESWPEGAVTVRCGGTKFRVEYLRLDRRTAVVSLVFDEWSPALGDSVRLLDGTAKRWATVCSVWVSPRAQRVELHLDFTR
ncbi:hypothetical protein DAETH_45210 (plasmid) [Deinococcus aetherius]|uniref:Uncharacterized protein n=1 Tax=Deinococcus aetherius TaxID=200252 RepID=A0ABN6RML5_9DEIO|nr:hypothetical protein [Deinococcus aetherius]BDP44552.1 hypothetical protein DAETH_45210 [Deinococcus aetherius]